MGKDCALVLLDLVLVFIAECIVWRDQNRDGVRIQAFSVKSEVPQISSSTYFVECV